MMLPVAWHDIEAARRRIDGLVHRTPVFTSQTISRSAQADVYFKCENLQRTGSFKYRGATNAVRSHCTSAGVYAHSSGNHAQALALAARIRGVPAHIVMPENSNPAKIAATKAYGARVVLCSPTHEDRWRTADRVGRETGATLVHPHDDPAVIAGQGTAICELIEETGPLDLILVPVGGGGLLSGALIAVRKLLPNAIVIGLEPAGADDASRSLAMGHRITDFTPQTIADGLRTPLGENTFEIIRRLVDEILVVPEAEILPAMQTVWERMKLVIEPSAAVAVAPLLSGVLPARGRTVGVVLSGGNVGFPNREFFAPAGGVTGHPVV